MAASSSTSSTSTSSLLHSGPALPATLLRRVLGIVRAAYLLLFLYLVGLPFAIAQQVRAAVRSPVVLFDLRAWRNAVVANGLPVLLRKSDESAHDVKRAAIFPFAHGTVLEIGAGTGMTLKYYDAAKVTKLYLVEPFVELHPALRKTIVRTSGLRAPGKTTVIPFGIEQRDKLFAAGVRPGTFDTIALVQVLCSIPEPKRHVAYLQTLLKPGGQLLLFEHVASDDNLTKFLQAVYNPVWTVLSGGCNVNRRSFEEVANLGGWQSMSKQRPTATSDGELYPHVVGRFVKA